jgi:hypothetical protein
MTILHTMRGQPRPHLSSIHTNAVGGTSVTVALIPPDSIEAARKLIDSLASHSAVSRVIVSGSNPERLGNAARHKKVACTDLDLRSGAGIARLLDEVKTEWLMIIISLGETIRFAGTPGSGDGVERFLTVAQDSEAGLLYSDFKDEVGDSTNDHPLIDYQLGSIRDTFDFGSVLLISKPASDAALNRHGAIADSLRWGGLYDLRLKLSLDHAVLRVQEPLYIRVTRAAAEQSGESHFDYVDPRRRDYQCEMEQVATAHLKRIGALLEPVFADIPPADDSFAVRASVVIPVRNRERTIRDAVMSALSQQASFDFNVIVVDNHSTDRTSEILAGLSAVHKRLIHKVPRSKDLGIGGCWNEAIYSAECGAVAVQLDSDDLYRDEHTLETIVTKFDEGRYAMVIGAYTIVDFGLEEIPPGLIDHREWTRENGRNNALRVNGLGAPRAFHVPALRRTGFPNTSYGEDYAVGLRLSREYEVGRMYEPLYYARRWEGNSDARLDLVTANRYDAYKDRLRTIEILARQRMNLK